MGLPEILITFKTEGTTAIERSERGIVALILKDSTDTGFDSQTYNDITDVAETAWTAANYDYIKKTLLGVPSKIIVERIASDATSYADALSRLASKKWNYLAIPGMIADDVSTVSAWTISQRTNQHKTFKAVLPNSESDHEGIINFATGDIAVGDKTYTTAEYCCRMAGLLAGLSLSRSSTYFELTEVDNITESADPNADIEAGKLILVKKPSGAVKIGRGVNSLTTLTASKGADFQKIKIIEGVDLVNDDIRTTFEDSYVGKIINNYDNKILFLAAVNAYLKELEKIDVLDANAANIASIDTETQRTYLQSQGVDVASLTDQQIKEYNTGSKVFASATVTFVDAMEDLTFAITME